MLMHVNAKKIATAGLLAAFSAVLVVLASVIESSSLFFIAAASFCVGIALREWGIGLGAGYLVASTFVNLIVSPNKFYCLTFAAMGLYLLLVELFGKKGNRRTAVLWVLKYVIFNCMYLPALVFFQELFFTKKITGILWVVVFLAGQAALFVYDEAYRYFQRVIWGKLRGKLQ